MVAIATHQGHCGRDQDSTFILFSLVQHTAQSRTEEEEDSRHPHLSFSVCHTGTTHHYFKRNRQPWQTTVTAKSERCQTEGGKKRSTHGWCITTPANQLYQLYKHTLNKKTILHKHTTAALLFLQEEITVVYTVCIM